MGLDLRARSHKCHCHALVPAPHVVNKLAGQPRDGLRDAAGQLPHRVEVLPGLERQPVYEVGGAQVHVTRLPATAVGEWGAEEASENKGMWEPDPGVQYLILSPSADVVLGPASVEVFGRDGGSALEPADALLPLGLAEERGQRTHG